MGRQGLGRKRSARSAFGRLAASLGVYFHAGDVGANGGAGGSIRLQAGLGGPGDGSGSPGANGEVVVNDSGAATSFRVESDADANCLVVDGANNAVRLGGATTSRVYQTAPSTAPSDGNLGAAQISFYLDESGDNLKVRVKYSNGSTLKTGTLALS